MAEVIGVASAIAGLISLTMEITQLSYKLLSDIRSAQSTQKQYLREVSALTEVLLRSEEAVQSLATQSPTKHRPVQLSQSAIKDCTRELEDLRSELTKPTPSIFWPIKEKVLRRHIEDLHRFRSTFSGFIAAQTLVTASATHREVSHLSHRQNQADLLEWVGNPKDNSRAPLTPLPGTGQWFLDSDAYRNWVGGEGSSILWCHGPPGVGKSMLACLALQDLSQAPEPASVCLLHYFCDFSNRKEQKKEAVWGSLLRQVIEQENTPTLEALISFRRRLRSTRPASWKDLSDALATVCSVQQVVLLIDGPDELENLKDMKAILHPFIASSCRILVTSRDLPDIRAFLTHASVLAVQADRNDLRTYVISQFEENDLEDVLYRYPEIEEEIIDRSNGIFLLGKILVDHLLELTTVKEMRKALQSSPKHLEQAFESSLERINAQSKAYSALAHRVIGWITSAERTLSLTELLHGLATEDGADVIDEENLITVKTLLKVCGGLVVVNSQDNTVNMVHTTVYKWFRNRDTRHFHQDLARTCLRYLAMRPMSVGPVSTADKMSERMKSLQFLPYAAQYWHKHLLDDEMQRELADRIDILLDSQALRCAAFQASNFKGHVKDLALRSATFDAMPTGQSALHIAAYWNLARKISILLEIGEDVNATDSQNWTPLHWACFGRSQKAVSILLSHGAKLESTDSVGWTPLFWAALNGDSATVQLFLESGANYAKQDVHGWTPLRWAAARKETEVVEILLRHHSDVMTTISITQRRSVQDLTVEESQRQLSRAAIQRGHLHELDDDAIDFDDLYAVLQDDTFDIRLLWDRGHFDPPVGNVWRTLGKAENIYGVGYNIGDGSLQESESIQAWRTRLLHAAIRDDQLLALKLLLELGAQVNSGHRSRTPLHTATFRTNPAFANVLIQHGAELEAIDYQGLTALQQAVINGFEETVKVLVTKGAQVNSRCDDDRLNARNRGKSSMKTPLMLACGLSAPEKDPDLPLRIIRFLLEHGADINMRDAEDHGMSVIHYAARSGNPRILKLVMDAGADAALLDNFGRTAAHHLALAVDRSWTARKHPDGDPPSRMARDCLELLTQKMGLELLDQSAEWHHHWETAPSFWLTSGSHVHTPLSVAIVEKNWVMVHELHRLGARFETTVPLESLLRGSLIALQPVAVDLLLQNGAKYSSHDDDWISDIGYSPDVEAFKSGKVETIIAILEKVIPHGFDIDARGDEKRTLLHYAVYQRKSYKLTKALLDLGADPCLLGAEGFDCFVLACLAREFDILRCLVEHMKNHPVKSHWTRYLVYSNEKKDSEILDQICAAMERDGATNIPNKSGTILCKAASSGDEQLVQALLKNKADVHLGSHKRQRPIHFAAENGHASIVDMLLRSGADVEAQDEGQRTALHIAARYGHAGAVGLLLSNGARTDVVDSEGWQPLHFACWRGHTETARLLLEAGASVQATTSRFSKDKQWCRPSRLQAGEIWAATPLHLAAMAGNVDIVRLLLADESVNVDARTDNFEVSEGCSPYVPMPGAGPTALHIALDTEAFYGRQGSELDSGRLQIASILVERGASVQGVADHIVFDDLKKFVDFPELWDKLRAGISEEYSEDEYSEDEYSEDEYSEDEYSDNE